MDPVWCWRCVTTFGFDHSISALVILQFRRRPTTFDRGSGKPCKRRRSDKEERRMMIICRCKTMQFYISSTKVQTVINIFYHFHLVKAVSFQIKIYIIMLKK